MKAAAYVQPDDAVDGSRFGLLHIKGKVGLIPVAPHIYI